jgi:hypothetical protein
MNEYVNFSSALTHMEHGNKARYNDLDYFIDNDDICVLHLDKPCVKCLNLKAIKSNNWILL